MNIFVVCSASTSVNRRSTVFSVKKKALKDPSNSVSDVFTAICHTKKQVGGSVREA